MPLDLALTDSGYNPKTGRYNFSRGGAASDVLFDATQAYAVMVSCVSVLGGYWADSQHGNTFGNDGSATSRTPSQAEAATLTAVQPLVDRNLIENPQVSAVMRAPLGSLKSAVEVDVSWSTPGATDRQRRRLGG